MPRSHFGLKFLPLVSGIFVSLLSLTLLTSCASDRNYHAISPGEGPSTPGHMELREERQVSTFHFPRGLYTLEAADDAGYYYRAPRQVMKHAFAGFEPYDGGLFVRKDNPAKIRGYIVWAGGRTKIGNLSRAAEFRELPEVTPQPQPKFANPSAAPEYWAPGL